MAGRKFSKNLFSTSVRFGLVILLVTNLSACNGSSGGNDDSSTTTTSTSTTTSTTVSSPSSTTSTSSTSSTTTTTTLPTPVDLFSLGGTVAGLTGTLSLLNNDTDEVVLTNNGTYTFNTRLPLGEVYNVAVSQQPDGQICSSANSSGIVTEDITEIDITCTPDTVRVSLSGTISSAANILSDSDTNDPNTQPAFKSNDTFSTAQDISNHVKLNGFASFDGTNVPGDNFEKIGDTLDVYKVHLDADQLITLQVVDFDGADTYQGDIDLYLYDSEENLIDFSDSVGEFEFVFSTQEDDYFIQVEAYSGISKYVLSLGPDVTGSAFRRGGGADFVANEAIAQFKPASFVQNLSSAGKNKAMSIKHEDTDRATLVSFGQPANSRLKSTLQALSNPTLHPFHDEFAAQNPVAYEKYQTLKNIKSLNSRKDVEYAEPNYIYHATQIPNDTYFAFQWHYRLINLPQAWDITTGSSATGAVTVAIIDTGVVLTHPDLQGQFVEGYDFISDPEIALDGDGIDSNPNDPGDGIYSGSSSWHGTHVAGTVAAHTNNNLGVAGVAWDAKLMPLRALGYGGGKAYDIDQAVRYAAGLPNDSGSLPAKRADIINLSLAGNYSRTAQQTILQARDAGVIIVAAAGNENTKKLFYPASFDGVISVSATDYSGNRAPYSNFGQRIDIAAPGGNSEIDQNTDGYADGILSTLIDDTSGTNNFIYSFYQGTSMASPHVAGVLALMKAVFPDLRPDDVDALLQNGDMTNDAGSPGRDDIYGYGIIDALKAVQAVEQLAQGGDKPSMLISTPTEISLNSGESEAVLTLTQTGADAISITSFSDNASWLTVSPISVDQNGLGQYRVSVDRAGLTGSIYTGLITFNVSQGNPTIVPVSMAVSYQGAEGDAGTLYVLLNDEDIFPVDDIKATPLGNGQYSYVFENVSPGTYLIAAGSDVDNDFIICQYGESCGAYPSLDYFSPIQVTNRDIANLNFTADIFSGFVTDDVAQSNTENDKSKQQHIFRRKVITNNTFMRRLD